MIKALAKRDDGDRLQLSSGKWVKSLGTALVWLSGASSQKKMTERLRQFGRYWVPAPHLGPKAGGETPAGSLDEDDVVEIQALLNEHPRVRAQRERHAAARLAWEQRAALPDHATWRARQIHEDERRKKLLHLVRTAVEGEAGTLWRKDRRERCASLVTAGAAELAISEAIRAVLESVSRYATTRLGFRLRYTSAHGGKVSSRYLVKLDGNKIVKEFRLSDHEIPVYGEREARYDETGGPRWFDIVVTAHNISWSPDDWTEVLLNGVTPQDLQNQKIAMNSSLSYLPNAGTRR